MSRGRHAAADGSFGRSAGVAVGRGAILVLAAVVLGLLLLESTDADPPSDVVAVDDEAPETTLPDDEVTDTTEPPVTEAVQPPDQVRVLVANGTRVSGAASRAAQPVRGAGYNVLSPVDATEATKAATERSSVYFTGPEFEANAKAIQELLGLPSAPVLPLPMPAPVADIRGANVVVVVGPDLANPGAAATTTTAA